MAGFADGAQTPCARCHADLPAAAAYCPHCGTSTAPGRAPGPVLDGFTILRTLGRGGAAVVYLAKQESLDRQVAVKVLRRDVDEPRVWRRFRREARTIARLSGHPNVVTVYMADRSQTGQPFLVTEYLDRGSLGDVITAEGPLPPDIVAKVGVAVADALAAAHGMGILHRDVKPGNVLLDHHGQVKLGDFGIARLLAAQSVTTTDVIAFTPEHVAPEILRGESDGPWSDLYGLASTLAAALLGEPLFTRRPDERVEALLARKLMAAPPLLPASVPSALASVVARGLDPDPTRRPSLTAFREQLAAAAEALGAAVPLPPPTPATAATTANVIVPPSREAGDEAPDVPPGPLLETLRRRRGVLLAIPALLIALVAATLAIARLGDNDGDNASSITNPSLVAATSGGSTAQPSTTPASRAPATSTAVASTAPAATDLPTTMPLPGVQPPTSTDDAGTSPPESPPPATAVRAPTSAPAALPSPPPATLGAITAPEAETFVRSYYDAVKAGNYETSWSQLAPEFQRGKARSYEYYVGFWNDNDIEVGDIDLVAADQDRAVVNVELRWNGNTTAVTDQFTLRPDENGALLIASQNTAEDE